MKALKQQISSNFSIFKALKLVGAITHNVEIGQAGGGSLEKTIKRYALFAYGLPSGHFFQSKIGGLQGTNELYAPTETLPRQCATSRRRTSRRRGTRRRSPSDARRRA